LLETPIVIVTALI